MVNKILILFLFYLVCICVVAVDFQPVIVSSNETDVIIGYVGGL